MKKGKVVIVGRPSTGKSTLINQIMQQKVTITSPLPQTTRRNIRVLYSEPRGKLILTDTPGVMSKVKDLVSRSANMETPKELVNADVIVMVVDVSQAKSEEETKTLGLIRKIEAKKILVYNKIDEAHGSKDRLAEYRFLEDEFDETVALSALKGTHVRALLEKIFELMPEKTSKEVAKEIEMIEKRGGPLISLSSEEFVAELIREKAYLCLRQEVPYSINVEVKKIEKKPEILVVEAKILTTAERYKKMIIGKDGRKIKQIGTMTRKELELLTGGRLFLELEVEVDKHWPERLLV